ncbi:MAG: heparinase II/III family protein [Pseudomonadota bacterium]|nr:heparinase II/III family protein [Pseudomonadota bacterium]
MMTRWKLTKLEILYRQSWLFGWQLSGPQPASPLPIFVDPWKGNPQNGALIAQGTLPFPLSSEPFARFNWIRDLRDYGGSRARMTARTLILRWLAEHKDWSPMAWRPDIIATRLTNLCLTYGWFGESADEDFQHQLKQMMAVQFRCLSLDWQRLTSPFDQLVALTGLVTGQVALNIPLQAVKGAKDINALLDLIIPKVKGQLNPDGGHKSRRPETHLDLLRLLLECRVAMAQIGLADRPGLEELILKMAAIAKMWRHASGDFAHFHFAGALPAAEIEQIISRCAVKGRVISIAEDTGFVRMSAARSLVIMDTGVSGPVSPVARTQADSGTPASVFAFEFSVSNHQFIVNSGQTSLEPRLNRALCQTAAHSCLTLDGLDNHRPLAGLPASVQSLDVTTADDGFLIEGLHDGYGKSHGIIHKRQLFLAKSGNSLRGKDTLSYTGAPGEIPTEAITRFHLHPLVSAAKIKQNQVLLKIHNQKTGWVFKCRGGEVFLEQSVFMDGTSRLSCQQIVIRTPAHHIQVNGTADISWAFNRHSPSAPRATR